MFQVRRNSVWIGYAGSIQGAREIVRDEPSGSYEVDEVRASSAGSGLRSMRWGQLIRHPDGHVEENPHPWPMS